MYSCNKTYSNIGPCTAGAAQNGMPSGHSAIAVAVSIILTMGAPEEDRGPWAVISASWYLLVVTSRLAFLYHTPAQVLFGTLTGLAVVSSFSLVVGWPLSFLSIGHHNEHLRPISNRECILFAEKHRSPQELRWLAGLCAVVSFAWTPFWTWPESSTARTRAVAALGCAFLPFAVTAASGLGAVKPPTAGE